MKYVIIWFLILPAYVAIVPRKPLLALILSLILVFGYFASSLALMHKALAESRKELEDNA